MTTYYAKAIEALNQKVYDVNPALYSGLLSRMGNLGPVNGLKDPWNVPVIHYNAIEKVVNAKFGMDPKYADADSILHPAMTIPQWASWSVSIKEQDMIAINADPTGPLAQMLQAEIIAQQGYYVNIVDRFVANYLTTANPTTNKDHSADWVGAMSAQAATGTVIKPEDCNSTPGTITATSVKITGAGKAVDAINSGFNVIKKRFGTFVDSTSFQKLLKDQGNVFDLYINPQVVNALEGEHLAYASGEVELKTDVLEELRKVYNIVPTYAFDAAYDGASGTVAEYGMTVNTPENFVWQPIVDYQVGPWNYYPNPKEPFSGIFRKWGGMRFIAYPVAHKISGSWKKAFQHFSNIPFATS